MSVTMLVLQVLHTQSEHVALIYNEAHTPSSYACTHIVKTIISVIQFCVEHACKHLCVFFDSALYAHMKKKRWTD